MIDRWGRSMGLRSVLVEKYSKTCLKRPLKKTKNWFQD